MVRMSLIATSSVVSRKFDPKIIKRLHLAGVFVEEVKRKKYTEVVVYISDMGDLRRISDASGGEELIVHFEERPDDTTIVGYVEIYDDYR